MDCSDKLNVPLYRAFKDILVRRGWSAYQNTFKAIRDDSISFCSHFTNPSTILTNYMLAYLSLGAGENVAEAFRVAGASGADSAIVAKILSAQKSLHDCPDSAGGAAAREAYLSGNYQAVKVCSPYTLSRHDKREFYHPRKIPTAGIVSIIDISGRVVKKYSFTRESNDQSLSVLRTVRRWREGLEKAGVYFVKISSDNQNSVKKLVVAK
jgi:hypothetical protein